MRARFTTKHVASVPLPRCYRGIYGSITEIGNTASLRLRLLSAERGEKKEEEVYLKARIPRLHATPLRLFHKVPSEARRLDRKLFFTFGLFLNFYIYCIKF